MLASEGLALPGVAGALTPELAARIDGRGDDDFAAVLRAISRMRQRLRQTIESLRVGIGSVSAASGEQGRGFAVVAIEVRSLAQCGAKAAKEVKSLIESSLEKVAAVSQLVTAAGSTMAKIVSRVQRVDPLIAGISDAASQPSDGIGQVNGTISQLDHLTQQNAALVEQSAAAAESLRLQALRLNEVEAVLQADGP